MRYISFWSMVMILIYWIKKEVSLRKIPALLDASKEAGLEINAQETQDSSFTTKLQDKIMGQISMVTQLLTEIQDDLNETKHDN